MLLDPKKSLCSTNQSVVISRDKGQKTEHRAENPSGKYSIRHYKLDGVLIQQEECCDFLLLNDTGYKSYYIELKGQDVIIERCPTSSVSALRKVLEKYA